MTNIDVMYIVVFSALGLVVLALLYIMCYDSIKENRMVKKIRKQISGSIQNNK